MMPEMTLISLHTMMALPVADKGAPEWVHLMPAGEFSGGDRRGPYRVPNPAKLIEASMGSGKKLPLDENHATDMAAKLGGAAPARGWIVAMQARDDGIWGKVDWTQSGKALVQDRAYSGISPVFEHLIDGTITQVMRASLTNVPNLLLTSLHTRQENRMDLEKLRQLLGLPITADEAAIMAAIEANTTRVSTHSQQLANIARAAGQPADVTADKLVSTLTNLASKDNELVALQSQLTTLETERKREKAERAVEKARNEGKVIRAEDAEKFISMHMANPTDAEFMFGCLPSLHMGGIPKDFKPRQSGNADASAAKQVANLLGIDPDKFAAAQAAQGVK